MASWRALWRDERGEIRGSVDSDGTRLRLELHGALFEGSDFDGLAPLAESDPEALGRFALADGDLCGGTLVVEIPVWLRNPDDREVQGTIEAEIDLGRPRPGPRGGLLGEAVRLVLGFDGHRVESRGTSGWFEDELLELTRALPARWRLETCFGCALSDYSPAGHGLFGTLQCFRSDKAGYRAVAGKVDLFRLMEKASAPCVQETWRCDEFEARAPGTGYRG